ncbi:hypothetical protein [Streptomyces himalayensis]|uniref:Transposase n=1 Tax=Streptomyces himalayensis subsp. himalayensis TaxID=2756131 RepID=A0A7W0DVA3_9ACTN|nr:hypothetical protein [Streptomyces himalayensis]MBA2951865.1 hypothetical protein [Streptomyces himalayensis subsp. himalayensis]
MCTAHAPHCDHRHQHGASRWLAQGLLAELHDRLRRRIRRQEGRDPQPRAGIVDSQSVKADATVPAGSRARGGGK